MPAWVGKLTKNEREYLTLCLTAIEAESEDPQGDARILMEATASIDRITNLLSHEGYYSALSTGYIDGIRERAMALVHSCDYILNRNSRMSELPVVVLDRDPSMPDHPTQNG